MDKLNKLNKMDKDVDASKYIIESHSPMVFNNRTVQYLVMPLSNNQYAPLIGLGEDTPTERKYVFSTTDDYQDQIKIKLCRVETLEGDNIEHLGQYMITGFGKAMAEKPSIQVTFGIHDFNIYIYAHDLITKEAMEIERVDLN